MSYFKNYIVFILLVILFGVQTDLSSQKTRENYPDLSGFWKIKNGNILHFYQVGKIVYFTNREGDYLFIHQGTFIDSKSLRVNVTSIVNNSRSTRVFNGKLTLVNSKQMLWEWSDVPGIISGTQQIDLITIN
jgi:hypothetical protein